MTGPYWYLTVGALLALMAYLYHVIERLPVSAAMIYLVAGFLLGPAGADVLVLHPLQHRELLETLSEVAILISLFTAGVKLRVPLSSPRWSVPVRLATISMIVTIALMTLIGVEVLGLSTGMAVLLGAILAPTDPVLAAEVQLRDPDDRDRLRFGLTGEGAINDGTALPGVLLGLGLLGLHDLGPQGTLWFVRDLLWGTLGGLAIGFAVGHTAAWGASRLRRRRPDAVPLDEFVLLSVIALSYGIAGLVQALGFLAVFAAAVAMRRFDVIDSNGSVPNGGLEIAPRVLRINEQLERIAEVGLVLLLGAMISAGYWSWLGIGLAAALLLVVRPVAVVAGVAGTVNKPAERRLLCWFGIRGIGSMYYVAYVAGKGIAPGVALELFSAVFSVIAVSVVAHGVSATPLMALYERLRRRPA